MFRGWAGGVLGFMVGVRFGVYMASAMLMFCGRFGEVKRALHRDLQLGLQEQGFCSFIGAYASFYLYGVQGSGL